MEQEYRYMVCTSCMTYNHAPYIVDAMNGLTMQETTFPVITLIVDDASTDGEPEVIKQYLADHFQSPYRIEETDDYYLICADHNTNPNCTFVVFLLKYNHYSIKKSKFPYQSEWRDNAKYIAICEGDDYWSSPNKLQMQVDFLEKNQDYGLVRTNINRFHQADGIMEERFFSCSKMKDTHTDYIYNAWFAAPCTWLYRNELLHLATEEKAKIAKVGGFTGDLASILTISKYSKIKYLDDVTAVYRILEKSASHFNDSQKQRSFYKRIRKTQRYFANKDSLVVRARLEWIFLCSHIRGIYKRIESLFIQK